MRVVVADDVLLTREGISRLLRDAGIEVVAEAEDAAGLLHHVRLTRPDSLANVPRRPALRGAFAFPPSSAAGAALWRAPLPKHGGRRAPGPPPAVPAVPRGRRGRRKGRPVAHAGTHPGARRAPAVGISAHNA